MIYEPREDSYLLEKFVMQYSKDKSVLDLGSGSGIQARAALKAGAKSVLAADINPEAVVSLKKEGIPAIHSDMFSNISEKFDLIVCNPPYLPKDEREDSESELITSGGERGDEWLCLFLSQAPDHLKSKGKILIVLSSLTPREKINEIIHENGMKKMVIATESLDFESLEVWLIESKA